MKITEDTRTNRATLNAFNSQLRRVGLTLPDMPTPDHKAPDLPTRQDITNAAYRAIQAGKDPATDKEVQRLTTLHQVAEAGLGEHIDREQSKAALRHAEEHAPALIEQLAQQFTEAMDTMKEAAPIVGHVDLATGLTFTPGTGTSKVVAMAKAAEALHTATAIAGVWPTLMNTISSDQEQPIHKSLLWHCNPTWEQYTAHRIDGRHQVNVYGRPHNVWDMLHDGITVELATTADDMAERIETLEAQERAAEREAARREDAKHANYTKW